MCSLRLLDEAVKKDHLDTFDREQRSRDPIAKRSPHFPDRTTQVIDTWLANRLFELHIGNVLANGLAVVLRQSL